MAALLDHYIPIVGDGVVNELRLLGDRLAGKRIVNVNSTRMGGGVAEILSRLSRMIPVRSSKISMRARRSGSAPCATTILRQRNK